MLWSSTWFVIRASCILLVVLAPIDSISAQDLTVADQQEEIETREVVVSATKTPVPVTQVTSAVQVISGQELERKKIKTVIDALRLADGVFASSSGGPGTEATVKIRGAFSKHTLVLIDGVIVNSAISSASKSFGVLRACSMALTPSVESSTSIRRKVPESRPPMRSWNMAPMHPSGRVHKHQESRDLLTFPRHSTDGILAVSPR